MDLIRPTLAAQAGVVSRAQLVALDLEPHDTRRLLRRRELAAIHPGVYVDHTGDPTWIQRAWGAVLFCSVHPQRWRRSRRCEQPTVQDGGTARTGRSAW